MSKEILELSKIIWDYHLMGHELKTSDIIMVLGSHDTRVAERWVELFKQGYAKKILFSGWLGRFTNADPGFTGTTEADKFAQIAMSKGIPSSQILVENRSVNTWQNIQFSFEIIKDLWVQSIILVQKPYMERRTFATFSKQWPGWDVRFSVTSPKIPFEDYANEEIPMEWVIDIMVGDLQRIIEYPKKGFQIFQEVPETVIEAYGKLVRMGFTKNLI